MAYGKVGKHKYDEHEPDDWTKNARVQYIHENLKPQHEIDLRQAEENVKLLELKAVNRRGGKLRHVLHKAYHKFKPKDFTPPKERDSAKR